MAEKHTDEKLYRVVRKDGSHLNTKVNPDGTKSALQFTDDNNDLNGPVDLLEVDEEESKVKAGWENLKLFISAIKDFDKPIKVTQIVTEQKNTFKARKVEVVNTVEDQEEKKYALSPEEVELLLDTARRSALMIAASLSILNNSVVMDDGTNPERIEMIQRGIEQLSSKDITTQIDLLLEDKNSGLLDDASIFMLRAFREGMFIGNGTPIPVSRYTGAENLN